MQDSDDALFSHHFGDLAGTERKVGTKFANSGGMDRERAEAIARAPGGFASADITAALIWSRTEAEILRAALKSAGNEGGAQ